MEKNCNKTQSSLALILNDEMRGFSLMELIIAMAVGLVVLGGAYSIFTLQSQTLSSQERIVEMQQNVRSAMDMMTREVRTAGYNPAGASFEGITVNGSQLEIKADLDGNSSISGQENIIYAYNSDKIRITRNIGSGNQPFAENIETFTFQYLDAAGNITATSADVRMVQITITGRTAVPDPSYASNNGYHTYTLTSYVTPRNLAY